MNRQNYDRYITSHFFCRRIKCLLLNVRLACQSKSRINGVVGSQNDEGLFSDETLFEKKNLENLKHFYFDWQAKIYESARASELQKIFFRWNWISFSHPLEAFNKNFESKIEQTSKMMLTAKYIFSEEYKLMKWYLVKSNSFSLARCYVDKRLMFLFFPFSWFHNCLILVTWNASNILKEFLKNFEFWTSQIECICHAGRPEIPQEFRAQ